MSGFVSVILNPVRYFMVAGFAVLGLLYYNKLDLIVGGRIDFEQVLPSAINEFAPVGLLGLLIAGLIAAFMGTFSGTLNAAQAYIINDIYLKYVNPAASKYKLKFVNYISGLIVVVISIIIGIFALDVNDLLQWIVSALWGSYMVSNVLKWYWWRFNGYGYFWGMVAGIIPALIFPYIFKNTLDLYYFPIILLTSLSGSLLATYLTKPTQEGILKSFYSNVRPWGFWKPVMDKIKAENPSFKENKNFMRDMFNVFTGTIWQVAMMALPVFIVLLRWPGAIATASIIIITSLVLWKTWYLRLNES
jgi:Na+/proline symporter